MHSERTRVVVAMSGGVDSAVAAALLVERGYDVVGVTMKTYSPTRPAYAKSCCGQDDFDDARRSAAIVGIPHYVLDYEDAFRRAVVDRFVADYRSGRTPNPCVACNNFVKLGSLRAFADRMGAAYVATGHYARLVHGSDGAHLYAGDSAKDQSYALAGLRPDQLRRLLLPVGDLSKGETRERAVAFGLPVAAKAESQDICFVEGGDYRDVLERAGAYDEAPGDVLTADGRNVGRHDGISHFTVGQRRKLPATHFNDGPRYVTRIDPATNTIVIGREDELASYALIATDANLIRPERFASGPVAVRAMTRYRSPLNEAEASYDPERKALALTFHNPERAVAPGQLVVLYAPDDDEVLASATIESAA